MAVEDGASMVRRPPVTPTAEIEIERSVVTPRQLGQFLRAANPGYQSGAAPQTTAPLSFALALRRSQGPHVAIAPEAFAIHGGHDLELHHPIRVGGEYSVRGRVDEIFEKTGRSGPLTVIARRVRIIDAEGTPAVIIRDRQIVRWRPSARGADSLAAEHPHGSPGGSEIPSTPPLAVNPELGVGSIIGPIERRAPSAGNISSWAGALRDREVLFHDEAESNKLGYRGLVVPGPMQSAFIDDMLRSKLPAWTLTALSMTFRQSLIAGDGISIHAVVIEADDTRRVCDIAVESRETGETASAGVAELHLRK